MDRLTPEQRHKAMMNIHSADTSIEVRLRKALWHKGIRYRKNAKGLPGTPDIAITKWKIAVFCDGSFWHGKDFNSKVIGTHGEYWEAKIRRNMERDVEVNLKLKALGWIVLRFWGEDIDRRLADCVASVEKAVMQAKCPPGDLCGAPIGIQNKDGRVRESK